MFLYGLSLAPGLTGRTAGVEVKLSSHGGAGGGFNSHSSGARATVSVMVAPKAALAT